MTLEILVPLGVLLTALVAYLGHRMGRPRMLAEAKRATAQADTSDWSRFTREIERLDARVAAQDDKIAAMELERIATGITADQREVENKALRLKLAKLERRLCAIEALLKRHPITPELQADLDKLNRDN